MAKEGKPLKHAGMLLLSGLTSEELAAFRTVWSSISKTRKEDLLGTLVELSEENLELDFSAIFRSCLKDAHDDVRVKAVRGLWECEDRVAIRPLVEVLKDDPSEEVRAAAATALAKFAEMAQEGKLLSRDGERIREALLAIIHGENEGLEVRRRAIEAVASFNSQEIDQIIQDAFDSGEAVLRQSAIYAMGRSSDSQWLPTVLQEATHTSPAIRYEAASACGQLGDESIVPQLIQLIKDDDLQVQISAVQALGNIGGSLAKRALQQCAKLGDEALEEAAQAALHDIEFDQDPLGSAF
jgi:HEAT repeat protein